MTRNFATIGAVYEDGVTLIFDGEDAPSDKHYLCNTSVEYTAGDRVKIVECDDTYIVEYVVGPPGSGGGRIPPGGSARQVLQKKTRADGDVEWGNVLATVGGVPLGGQKGYVLIKNTDDTYSTKWARDVPYASGVIDAERAGFTTPYDIQFRYYDNRFWARFGSTGTWASLN